MTTPKLPVVARCQNAHEYRTGGYLRGVVFMDAGQFRPGTEDLFDYDSLNGSNFQPDSTMIFPTIEAAKDAADAIAVTIASIPWPEDPLLPEDDITQTIKSVEKSKWSNIDAEVELRTHVGELHEPDKPIQYFGGIERSWRGGGENDVIRWSRPYATREEAGKAADEMYLETEAAEFGFEYGEPESTTVMNIASPGMR